jgi:hypothetical protein
VSLFNESRLAAFEELPGDCFVAIHGTTSSSNVASISANGFRPSPAGCFGQGIYLAQNSSVALVHTCPKGQDFLAKGYFSKGKAFRSTGHFIATKCEDGQPPPPLNLIICFVKMRSHENAVYPPRPAMEMMYNGFPSTADKLSPHDVVIGEMPFRFFEAVVNDANRVYAAWHVQVHLVPGRSQTLAAQNYWDRRFLNNCANSCFYATKFSFGIVRLPNGNAAVCRFYPDAFLHKDLGFAVDKFLFAPLTPLQWAVVNRDFQECAGLLRAGDRAHFELPDFSLEELAQRLPQFTVPNVPGETKWELWGIQHTALAEAGLHVQTTGQALQENLSRLLMASAPDFHNPDTQYDSESDIRPVFYDPFPEILPVLRKIRHTPSHSFDAAAEAELAKAFEVNIAAAAQRKADAKRREEAQRRREAEEKEKAERLKKGAKK